MDHVLTEEVLQLIQQLLERAKGLEEKSKDDTKYYQGAKEGMLILLEEIKKLEKERKEGVNNNQFRGEAKVESIRSGANRKKSRSAKGTKK